MAAGALQLMVAGFEGAEDAAVMVICVDALRFSGDVFAADGEVPAGVASRYAACTVTVPGAFAIRDVFVMVAAAGFDSVHCVAEVTSWVVPSLRWATAFNTAEPPTLTVEGVAVTVSEARVWDEGLLQPVIKANKTHRDTKHTCGIGGVRI
jgi:hypothetical protein